MVLSLGASGAVIGAIALPELAPGVIACPGVLAGFPIRDWVHAVRIRGRGLNRGLCGSFRCRVGAWSSRAQVGKAHQFTVSAALPNISLQADRER